MPNKNGWIYDPAEIEQVLSSLENPYFSSAASNLKDYGVGKTVLLYLNFKEIGMEFPVVDQGTIGSCTAAAAAGLTDLTKATEIANGERSSFIARTSIEHLYRNARLGSRINGDGASVARCIQQMANLGTLAMIKYDVADLTKYVVDRCREWGDNRNYPKQLDEIAKNHRIGKYSQLRSYEEVRDSIAAGYPVICGSSYGYDNICDDNGFARQSTSWSHAMYFAGIRADVEGVLVINSWASWNKMPKRKFDEPAGSFWIRPENCDKMARNGDCWAVGDHEGYPVKINSVVW